MMTPSTPVKLAPGQPFPNIQTERQRKKGMVVNCTLNRDSFKEGQFGIIITLPYDSWKVDREQLRGFEERRETLKSLNCKVVVISNENAAFLCWVKVYTPKTATLLSGNNGQYGNITGLTSEHDEYYSQARSCVIVRNGIVEAVNVETDVKACTITSASATIAKIEALMEQKIASPSDNLRIL